LLLHVPAARIHAAIIEVLEIDRANETGSKVTALASVLLTVVSIGHEVLLRGSWFNPDFLSACHKTHRQKDGDSEPNHDVNPPTKVPQDTL
jgi:hypothetical protein